MLPARNAWKKKKKQTHYIYLHLKKKKELLHKYLVVPKGGKTNLECACVCVCVYTYIHTYIYVCVCVCVCVYLKMFLRLPSRMHDSEKRDLGAQRSSNYYEFIEVVMIPWRW